MWRSDVDSGENSNVWDVVGQVRIAAVSLETGVVSHGQMLLLFRGENYSGAVGVVIVKLAYLCE